MRLLDLNAKFVRREIRPCQGPVMDPECHTVSPHTEHEYHVTCELAEADGVIFLCPKCFQANGGPTGTHSILCWRPRVPEEIDPKPGRWEFEGSGLHDLTLRAGSSSILLTGGCCAHFFITGGAVT